MIAMKSRALALIKMSHNHRPRDLLRYEEGKHANEASSKFNTDVENTVHSSCYLHGVEKIRSTIIFNTSTIFKDVDYIVFF